MLNKAEYFKKMGGSTSFPVQQPSQLITFLLEAMQGKSRTSIKSYLAHGQIMVNGAIIRQFDHQIKPGDMVEYNSGWVKKSPTLKGVSIVFEDTHLIVIEKEAGLLSIATDREKQRTAYRMISEYVKVSDFSKRIFVLHRLDRDTSGLMMFAKSERIQEVMQKTWDTTIQMRRYIALVEGNVEKDAELIRSWLRESPKSLKVHASTIDNGGQLAVTHYRVLDRKGKYTRVELTLDTGRKNQIRVQMAQIGHPVAGDKKYGAKTNPIGRMALHAHELSFIHPVTGERMSFTSPIPKGF